MKGTAPELDNLWPITATCRAPPRAPDLDSTTPPGTPPCNPTARAPPRMHHDGRLKHRDKNNTKIWHCV